MTDLKTKIDEDLFYLNLNASEEDIIIKANRKQTKNYTYKALIAATLVIAIIAGIIFVPPLFDQGSDYSFAVYAGAVPLSTKDYVIVNGDDSNFIHFNFNKILDEDASPTEITKKYLFYSFEKRFNLRIEGENIDRIYYFINDGLLTCFEKTPYENEENAFGVSYDYTYCKNGEMQNLITLSYDRQENQTFIINPICSVNNFIRSDLELETLEPHIALPETGEVITDENLYTGFPDEIYANVESLGYNPIAYGIRTNEPSIATDKEVENLTQFAKANDMVGFYNYQNQIFKRLIDEIEIDAVISKTNGQETSYEVVTIKFCYNPIDITTDALSSTNYSESLSKGTLSAKLTETDSDRQEYLLGLFSYAE